jgi:hypothetical protein
VHDGLCLFGMHASKQEPSPLDGDESERRAREEHARQCLAGSRMLEHDRRGGQGLVELSREVERARMAGRRTRRRLVQALPGELDRAAPVAHRLRDATVHRERMRDERLELEIGVRLPALRRTRCVGDLEEVPLLESAAAGHEIRQRGG